MILRALRRLRRWRSSITGRFVSKGYAAEHPDTTVAERLRPADQDLDFALPEDVERERNLREEHYP